MICAGSCSLKSDSVMVITGLVSLDGVTKETNSWTFTPMCVA